MLLSLAPKTYLDGEGRREGAISKKDGVGESKRGTLRNNKEKRKERRILPIWHRKN